MATDFRPEAHLSDGVLIESILSRESIPSHAAECPTCRDRAEALARLLDPAADDPKLDGGSDVFWSRQAARIRGRIAEAPRPVGWLSRFGFSTPRAIWGLAGASAAASVVAVLGLGNPTPAPSPFPSGTTASAAAEWTTEDMSGDELLRGIDALIEEDSGPLGMVEG